MKNTKPVWPRRLAPLVLLCVVGVACSATEEDSPTTTRAVAPDTTTTSPVEAEADVGGVFRVGLVDGITTDNWWEALDREDSAQNRAYLTNSKMSLFALTLPGFVYVPVAAATDTPVAPVQEGDVWVVEQPMRDDIVWSDGAPLTANDLVFYFDTVRRLELGGAHADSFDASVLDVTAPDDYTLRIEFDKRPTLAVWNNGVALARIPPAHFWEAQADAAAESGGAAALYSVSGLGEPSTGPMIVEDWQKGALATTVANPEYFDAGTEQTLFSDGSVRIANSNRDEDRVFGGQGAGDIVAHLLQGPFVSKIEWVEYRSREDAYEALTNDEVDYVLDPDGMTSALRNELATNSDLDFSTSPAEGFRYLAFNMRKAPMSDSAFRRAIATVIDKELIAGSVLADSVDPAYTIVNPELTAHHNADVEKAGWADGEPMSEGERFESAIQILGEAGYTWATEPVVEYNPDGTFSDVTPGQGMMMPNGAPVPDLTLLAPGPQYDPLRDTFAIWSEQWMNDLGIPVDTEPTSVDTIVDAAFPPQTPESALGWDMYILGWGSSEPSLPGTALRAFFHSDQDTVRFGGFNTSGYSSEEFDAVGDAFYSASTVEEAAELTKEMEAIVAEDLPYVVLFRTRIFEAYRNSVQFPVESILAGHAGFANAWPASVRITQ